MKCATALCGGCVKACGKGASVRDQLGGFMDLKVDAQPGEVHDDSFKRPGAGLQKTRLLIDGFENACGRWNSLRKILERGMQCDARTDRIRSLRKRFHDELGEISFGRFARLKSDGDFGFAVDAIDAEGAPVLAGAVPCDEIPAGSGVDEAMGLDRAHSWRTGAILIFETKAFAIAASARDSRKKVGIDTRTAAAFKRDDESMKCGDSLAETRRQDLLEFEKGADRGFFNAGNATLRRSSQAERDGDGFVIIE